MTRLPALFGIATISQYAAAALGIFLTSPQTVKARFSPDMPYHYEWVDWAYYGGGVLGSDGGLGVLIYKDGEPQPIVDQRVRLWNNTVVNNP